MRTPLIAECASVARPTLPEHVRRIVPSSTNRCAWSLVRFSDSHFLGIGRTP